MLFKTVCTVYYFKDATASVKMDNKSPFNKKIKESWYQTILRFTFDIEHLHYFLLVSRLRLSQWEDDTAVGWLKPLWKCDLKYSKKFWYYWQSNVRLEPTRDRMCALLFIHFDCIIMCFSMHFIISGAINVFLKCVPWTPKKQ